jgi:cobyrinic acid a,c-diamide synthase
MYQENIEILNQLGQVTFFSPMKDHSLPATDLLYLPGGYPELYAEELSTNHAMKTSIHAFCENGGKAIAECGGMMYLGKELLDKEGKKYSMVNFLDIETSMQHAKLSLGYRNIVVDRLSFNGHEFHYSTCSEKSTIASMGEVFNAKGMKVNSPIYQQKNVIASYIHFYWGENAELLDVLFSEKKSGNG